MQHLPEDGDRLLTAARVAWLALSGLSIMKSCVVPS
jgi:hypothetical protein